MFTVISILWGGMAAGYVLRRRPVRHIGRVVACAIWILLFLMGAETGGNPALMQSLGRLGLEAAALTVSTATGCLGLSWALWKATGGKRMQDKEGGAPRHLRQQITDSATILAFFLAGILAGQAGLFPDRMADTGFYALCALMACVGFGIGQTRGLFGNLKQIDRRWITLPLVTVAGTWAGAAAVAALMPRHSLTDWLAASSGFGYYSLSGILITELRHAELGNLALMYNLLRELVALLFAPFIARAFGPLAPVSQGGAASGDTVLPAVTACCGKEMAALAVFHGVAVDLSVPFLVTFFCTQTITV